MKNTKMLLVTVLSLLLIVLAACGESNDGNSNSGGNNDDKVANEEKVKIGIAMKTEVQPRWKFEIEYMEELAEELNAEIVVQWANDDVTKQGNQIENLLSQGIDALIVVPVTDKIGPFIQSAKNEGIPVVSYDALPLESDVDLFITRDNFMVGELQAKAALEFADNKGNIGILKGDPATSVAQGIAEAYEDYLINNDDITIVTDHWHQNWSTEDALNTAENALSSNEDDVIAFVSSNDGMAMGVAQALKGRNLEGEVFISGMDVELGSAKLIAEGIQTMSVWTKIDDQAQKAVVAAVDLANGEEVAADSVTDNDFKEVPTIFSEVIAINQDNLCEFINEISPQGWITVEEVYGDLEVPSDCN